jgi:hypothetical protein
MYWIMLLLALALQGTWKYYEPAPSAHARDLPAPPDPSQVRAVDLGEHAFAGQWLSLELFSHD